MTSSISGVGIRVKRSGFKEGLVWRREWMSGRREVVGREAIQSRFDGRRV
jgi:hypothetical protein